MMLRERIIIDTGGVAVSVGGGSAPAAIAGGGGVSEGW